MTFRQENAAKQRKQGVLVWKTRIPTSSDSYRNSEKRWWNQFKIVPRKPERSPVWSPILLWGKSPYGLANRVRLCMQIWPRENLLSTFIPRFKSHFFLVNAMARSTYLVLGVRCRSLVVLDYLFTTLLSNADLHTRQETTTHAYYL